VIELLDDSKQFARNAGPLLESTVLNTVLATVLHGVVAGHYDDSSPRFAIVTDGAGEVTGAALRTPPWPLVCTALSAGDAGELMQLWLVEDPELSGVSAALATSRALAAAWSRLTGGTTTSVSSQALHSLDREGLRDPSRPARGYLRVPTADERAGVVAWDQAAIKEMGVDASPDHAARMAHRRIDDGRELVWDDGGLVALVGHTPMVAGVPRVGPLYTLSTVAAGATRQAPLPRSVASYLKAEHARSCSSLTSPTRRRTESTPTSDTDGSLTGKSTVSTVDGTTQYLALEFTSDTGFPFREDPGARPAVWA